MCYNYAASCGKDHNQKFRRDKSLNMSTKHRKPPSKLNIAKNQNLHVVPKAPGVAPITTWPQPACVVPPETTGTLGIALISALAVVTASQPGPPVNTNLYKVLALANVPVV